MYLRGYGQDTPLLLETRGSSLCRCHRNCWRTGYPLEHQRVLMENFCATKWSITAEYRLIGSNRPGHLTCVYGPANPRDKQAFLRSLCYISSLTQRNRWIIGGDFNIIRTLMEKKGGSRGWIETPATSTA
jgi:hypothetical protein